MIVSVGLCQIASGYVLALAMMIALLAVCFDCEYQITQTLTIAQLAKHQRKELVATCEMLHILISTIFGNDAAEHTPIKERY